MRTIKEKPRSVEEIQSYWDNQADEWYTHEILTEYFVDLVRETLLPHFSALPQDCRILDIASGANPFDYIPVGYKNSMHALDLSNSALKLNPSRLKIMADARKTLPFQDGSFDLVTSIFGMRYFPNHEKVIREALRILKERGRFVLIDFECAINGATVDGFYSQQLKKIALFYGAREVESIRLFPGNSKDSPMDMLTGIKL